MTIELSTITAAGTLEPTFTAMHFPAGEAHIKIAVDNPRDVTEVARLYGTDANDLITLGMWADAVAQRGSKSVALIPYLPGARQDRGFPFGARVYADIINSFHIFQVICFDPHSPVMPGLINRLTVINSAATIRRYVVGRADSDEHPQRYTGIIAPDAGAAERASRVAAACHLPLYTAGKHRNPDTGKLSDFTCESLPADGKYLIVDDIADAGGTFVGLALATHLPKAQLGLWVSHGVFSGNAPQLRAFFADIYTTDSFPPVHDIGQVVIPIGHYLHAAIQ